MHREQDVHTNKVTKQSEQCASVHLFVHHLLSNGVAGQLRRTVLAVAMRFKKRMDGCTLGLKVVQRGRFKVKFKLSISGNNYGGEER